MARLIGPDSGDRATVRPGGAGYARSAPVVVYAASSGTTLANILTEDGDAVAGSTLTTDDFGLIPLFQFPDGVDTVYVEVDGGPRTAVYARYDDRVDGIAARVATLETTTQVLDGDLTTIAGLDSSTAGALVTDGSGWIRKTYAQLKTAMSFVKGDVGLGNVDNTSDANKPISTATQTALDLKLSSSTAAGTYLPGQTAASSGNTKAGEGALAAVVAGNIGNGDVTGIENTAYGVNAMTALTTGSYNTAVGYNALQNGTASDHCTAVGYDALRANTSGTRNTAIGTHALDSNTNGNENTALGDSALNDNTTGLENTAAGTYASQKNTTGRENAALGFFALRNNLTGSYNVGLGTGAVQGGTAMSRNVGVGYYSLGAVLTTDGNVAVGDRTLAALTSGGNSVAVGYNALRVATTGDANTAVGYEALVAAVGGNNNTALGYRVLDAVTSANKNTGIGYNALSGVTTGNNNTAIGGDAGNQPSATGQISWATTTAQGQVLVGYRAGQGSSTARDFITAVGALATVDVNDGTALGVSATVASGHTASVALGGNTATTAARQVAIGNKHIEMTENTAPAAPAADGARLYAVDNGSGKTQLCVRFATGAVQVLATEP